MKKYTVLSERTYFVVDQGGNQVSPYFTERKHAENWLKRVRGDLDILLDPATPARMRKTAYDLVYG